MGSKLEKVVDECIERIRKGEAIENCLAQYAHIREQLEPLLRIALSVTAAPIIGPSEEFRRAAKGRLMARLYQENIQRQAARSGHVAELWNEITVAWQGLWRALTPMRNAAVPITLALLLIIVASFGINFNDFLNYLVPPLVYD